LKHLAVYLIQCGACQFPDRQHDLRVVQPQRLAALFIRITARV
jgi:hypothetical protein